MCKAQAVAPLGAWERELAHRSSAPGWVKGDLKSQAETFRQNVVGTGEPVYVLDQRMI